MSCCCHWFWWCMMCFLLGLACPLLLQHGMERLEAEAGRLQATRPPPATAVGPPPCGPPMVGGGHPQLLLLNWYKLFLDSWLKSFLIQGCDKMSSSLIL